MDFDYNYFMFQLTDASLERIIFAMEDQSKSTLINLETGDLIEADLVPPEERDTLNGKYASPPMWDSQHGFSLLEAFSATVTSPPELKVALNAALRRGKGVFKAFRAALSSDEALFQRFQEFKLRAMRPFVEAWMNVQREGKRLAAFKDEPEDIGDLIASEIDTLIVQAQDAEFDVDTFILKYSKSSDESVPHSLRAWFLMSLEHQLRDGNTPMLLAFATADGTNPLMVGFFSIQQGAGTLSLCVVHGILSREDTISLGIEWQILETIATYSQNLGISQLVLEGPLFPASFAQEAEEHGFRRAGSILFRTL